MWINLNNASKINRLRSSTKLAGVLCFFALGWLRAARLPALFQTPAIFGLKTEVRNS